MDKEECEDKYSETETEEHRSGKLALFKWIEQQRGVINAILEAWISETKQRPDIMFVYNGQRFVIEYQCSPISSEYLERHELYQACGIKDIWICGVSKYMKDNMRIKELEKYAIGYYSAENNLFYFQNCHSGYGEDITRMFHAHNKWSKTFGCKYPWDEERNSRYAACFCCEIDLLNFKNGEIIFKNYNSPQNKRDYIYFTIEKRKRLKNECNANSEKRFLKIQHYFIDKMTKLYPVHEWNNVFKYRYESNDCWIYFTCLSSIYGDIHNVYDKSIDVEGLHVYLNVYNIFQDLSLYCQDKTKRIEKIQKSLYYFSRKSNVNLHIVSNSTQDTTIKYYKVCKGSSTVNEFDFLENFISILNKSLRYSKDVYIKFPDFLKTLFGYIHGSDTEEIKIYLYRLGFTEIFLEK